MTEAELQDAIVDLARTFGWRAAHFRPARTAQGWRTPGQYDAKGFCDLVLVHPDLGLIFAEIKGGRGRLSPEQRVWIEGLIVATESARDVVRVAIWTPADWPDHIAPLLTGGRATSLTASIA